MVGTHGARLHFIVFLLSGRCLFLMVRRQAPRQLRGYLALSSDVAEEQLPFGQWVHCWIVITVPFLILLLPGSFLLLHEAGVIQGAARGN